MTVQNIIQAIREHGAELEIEGSDLILVERRPLPEDLIAAARRHKPELLAALTHPDLHELTQEFIKKGRIRIEHAAGAAWLVESCSQADDIREGAAYSAEMWPHFIELDPAHKLQVHEFLCGLGGGRFDRLEDPKQKNQIRLIE